MAGTARTGRKEHRTGSEVAALREEFNKVIADLESIRVGAIGGDGGLLSAPGLTIGTSSKAEVKNVAAAMQLRGSGSIAIGAAETAFTATTHDIADPDTDPREAYYVLSVQADGSTITITKGADAVEDAAVKPAAPAGEVILGWVKIQHDGSAIFDATTDDLDSAHLTVTYEDAPLMAASALLAGTVNA
ncbi:MAG: hypothetical protein AMS18_00050 [Gemmatimonas sp. SG8_17]|nr:MAG: hypothetical protein AMS18_00050 [Gemmatimonas sp. SG8_17]